MLGGGAWRVGGLEPQLDIGPGGGAWPPGALGRWLKCAALGRPWMGQGGLSMPWSGQAAPLSLSLSVSATGPRPRARGGAGCSHQPGDRRKPHQDDAGSGLHLHHDLCTWPECTLVRPPVLSGVAGQHPMSHPGLRPHLGQHLGARVRAGKEPPAKAPTTGER